MSWLSTVACALAGRLRSMQAWGLALAGVVSLGIGSEALAQAQGVSLAPAPTHPAVDANGVDLTTGHFSLSVTDLSIGNLSYHRTFTYSQSNALYGWKDNLTGSISLSGSNPIVATISIGDQTYEFKSFNSGSTFTTSIVPGITLIYDANNQYVFTAREGTVYTFARYQATNQNGSYYYGPMTSVTAPTGDKRIFHYKTASCIWLDTTMTCTRLRAVTSNLGYQMRFSYADSTTPSMDPISPWQIRTEVIGINDTVVYCDPTQDACTPSGTWPKMVYAFPDLPSLNRQTATYSEGTVTRTTEYTYGSVGSPGQAVLTGIKRPGSSSNDVTINYLSDGRVSSVVYPTGTWSYSYSGPGSGYPYGEVQQSTTVTPPTVNGSAVPTQAYAVAPVSGTAFRINRTQIGNRESFFGHDENGLPSGVTSPEGISQWMTRDDRGNINGSGTGRGGWVNPSSSAEYAASCTTQNRAHCNKPLSVTDPAGVVTTYSYVDAHGGVDTMTVGSNSTTPTQVKYGYATLFAKRLNSSLQLVNQDSPVHRLTSTSTCATALTCANTENELKTTVFGFDNNLLPSTTVTGAGDGASDTTETVVVTYDALGRVKSENGPIAGDADTTHYIYKEGLLEGVIPPDPDPSTASRPATKTIYNLAGDPIEIHNGTVNGVDSTAWAAFVTKESSEFTYQYGLLVRETLFNGTPQTGVKEAVTQYSYDARGRVDCVAVRLNPAAFNGATAACTATDGGLTIGWDRVTKNYYNEFGEVWKVETGYGISGQAALATTYTFNKDGQVRSLTDPRGYMTEYTYDYVVGRPQTVKYPQAGATGQSNANDDEVITYDADGGYTYDKGRPKTIQLRNDRIITLNYDDRGRVNTRVVSGTGGYTETYSYDRLGRTTSVAKTGAMTVTMTFDALGRQRTETVNNKTVTYGYDNGGRRSSLTYPGGFAITYDWDTSGALKRILQGGNPIATFAYDAQGRRSSLTYGGGPGVNHGAKTTYGYNELSELASLDYNLAGTAQDRFVSFGRNKAGQITTKTNNNPAYEAPPAWPMGGPYNFTANGLNQYGAAAFLTQTYGQPGTANAGNLISQYATANPSVVTSYGYDPENRLTSVQQTGLGTTNLTYDALGRLYQMGSTTFVYDGADIIAEYASGVSLQRRYVHGPSTDEPLAWFEGSGTTDVRYLLADERGSITAVAASSGTTVNRYDEFGIPASTNIGLFQYTGQIWMPQVGLYHYKARAYAPALGKFLQPDPIGYEGGLNLYAYVNNDPINFKDPWGLLFAPIVWADIANHGCEFLLYYGGIGESARKDEFGYTADNWEYLKSLCEERSASTNSGIRPSGGGGGSGGSGSASQALPCGGKGGCISPPDDKCDAVVRVTLFHGQAAGMNAGHIGLSINGAPSYGFYGQERPQCLFGCPGSIQRDRGQVNRSIDIPVTRAQARSLAVAFANSAQNGGQYSFLQHNCAGYCSLALAEIGFTDTYKLINRPRVFFNQLASNRAAINPRCPS